MNINALLKKLKFLFKELTGSEPTLILIDEEEEITFLSLKSGRKQFFFFINNNVCYINTEGVLLTEAQSEKYGVKNGKM